MEDLEEFKYDLFVEFIFIWSHHDRAIIHIVFKVSGVLVMQGGEDVIHKALHIGWGISWTKGHYFRA
jgi:hypothetical protein